MQSEPDADQETDHYPPDHPPPTSPSELRRIVGAIIGDVGEDAAIGEIEDVDEDSLTIVTDTIRPLGLALKRGDTGTETTATATVDTSIRTCVHAIFETIAMCGIAKFGQESIGLRMNHPRYRPKMSHHHLSPRPLHLLAQCLTELRL